MNQILRAAPCWHIYLRSRAQNNVESKSVKIFDLFHASIITVFTLPEIARYSQSLTQCQTSELIPWVRSFFLINAGFFRSSPVQLIWRHIVAGIVQETNRMRSDAPRVQQCSAPERSSRHTIVATWGFHVLPYHSAASSQDFCLVHWSWKCNEGHFWPRRAYHFLLDIIIRVIFVICASKNVVQTRDKL